MADNSAIIKVGAVAVAAYVAYTQGWLSFLGIAAPTASASTGTPASGASANSSGADVPASTAVSAGSNTPAVTLSTGARSLAQIQAATILAANAPAAGMGVDGWGYYLNSVINPMGATAPDPMPLFSAAIPGFDRSQLVTAQQYWAVMGPALSPLGFSGLGMWRAW